MHFKYRKESKEYCPKMSPIFGHSLPRVMGCGCPAQGLSMPTWWATDARVTGTSRPTEGHRGTSDELTFPVSVDTFLLYKLER